jgi:GNAT superfamily N-acetyltransferase
MIREAKEKDIQTIIKFINELAVYEKMQDQVILNQETLFHYIFKEKIAHVYLVTKENIPVGFVLFFYNFSTFLGQPGIYIEDIYIQEPYRNKGYGKLIFKTLVERAKEENISRIEWSCLDWNTPSIEFYKKIGAVSKDEWITFRLDPSLAQL